MIIVGIMFGLLCATCQSLCYLLSRRFVTRPGQSSSLLFGLSHVWMGLFAVIVLPFVYSPAILNIGSYIVPLLCSAGFYLLGQVGLFQAVRWTDASRVSPLLGLKILILTLILACIFGEPVTPLQWIAVFICLIAAVGLNWSGGSIPWQGLILVLSTCLWYSLSDISIFKTLEVLAPEKSFPNVLMTCCLTYLVCAPVGWAMILLRPGSLREWSKWRMALPVSVFWFIAMVALFACLALLGVVFGNIVQATRGPISILLGLFIAYLGHEHLEKRVNYRVIVKRILAAILMIVAIGLFSFEKDRVGRAKSGHVVPSDEYPLEKR
jgi:drug/metabolite transporter (DMT)-like permease